MVSAHLHTCTPVPYDYALSHTLQLTFTHLSKVTNVQWHWKGSADSQGMLVTATQSPITEDPNFKQGRQLFRSQ